MGWWENTPAQERAAIAHIQIKVDNGPESSGVRTQFLNRIVEFVDHTRTIVQLLYYPPYHSKYNPIERCWGILEQHWNGAKLVTAENVDVCRSYGLCLQAATITYACLYYILFNTLV